MATFSGAGNGVGPSGAHVVGTVGVTAFSASTAVNLIWRSASRAVAIRAAAGEPFGVPDSLAEAFESDMANGRIPGLGRAE